MEILYVIGIIVIAIVLSTIFNHYRMKGIAISRGDADICKYARSFDYRNVDTKIIREVYEKVQEWSGNYEGKPFPVVADDNFDNIYQMDPDDLDDIYWEVADKFGISTDNPEANPYYGKVTTVQNLVLFLHHQPRISHA